MIGRRRRVVGWLAALLIAALALAGLPAIAAAARTAVVIALDGAIGPATASYVVRSLDQARRSGAAVAILRIDTPGGLGSAMRDIIKAMLASPVPVLAYVAPGGARAASAGTYILAAAALAAMAPGTNVGAATPVSLFGGTRLPAAGKGQTPPVDAEATKITNDAVAYIRGLATLHGRNADWAEQAVRQATSLPYDQALRLHVIDIVAADLPDLLAQANGRRVIVDGRPVVLATTGLATEQVRPDWRDRLIGVLTNPSLVYLLLLAGLFGVVFELSHPGLFAPGVIGVICLLLGGYGLDLLPIDYAGLALAVLGIGLMAAEAFIPAFGAFVLGGAVAFVIGSLLMFENAAARPPLGVIAAATVAVALLFGGLLALLLRARRRPVVTGTAALVGLAGQAESWSGDEGEVLVQGERWRARSRQTLRPGQAVRVVGRLGLTLLVEAVSPVHEAPP